VKDSSIALRCYKRRISDRLATRQRPLSNWVVLKGSSGIKVLCGAAWFYLDCKQLVRKQILERRCLLLFFC